MKDALESNIRGIKCDHCDYVNMDVKVEDYDKWLNKPCPKCGANLLTQEDFDNTKALIELTNMMNSILPQSEDNEEIATMTVNMNGTGDIDFELDDLGKTQLDMMFDLITKCPDCGKRELSEEDKGYIFFGDKCKSCTDKEK